MRGGALSGLPDTGPIDWVLTTTRSVRKRLDYDRPVHKDVLLECLELAVQAPTGSHTQNWHWIIVADPQKKAAIAELYRSTWRLYNAMRSAEGAEAEEGQAGRIQDSAEHLAENLHRAPYFVIPAISVDQPWAGLPHMMTASLYGSILPAAWSFLLALRSRGLGSTWTTMHLLHEAESREILGLPEHIAQVALFPVAHTVGTDFKPAKRTVALSSVTHWDGWTGPEKRI